MDFNKLLRASKSQGLPSKGSDQLADHPSSPTGVLEGQITPTESERSTSNLLGSLTLETIISTTARSKRKRDPKAKKIKKKKTLPQVFIETEEEDDPSALETRTKCRVDH